MAVATSVQRKQLCMNSHKNKIKGNKNDNIKLISTSFKSRIKTVLYVNKKEEEVDK